jgi:hypothetical protein
LLGCFGVHRRDQGYADTKENSPSESVGGCDLLLQLRVFGFRFFQDGDVGIGVFPEREEVIVGSQCPDAGGIRIRST